MNRALLSCFLVLTLAFVATSDALAEQKHEKWLNFWSGKWTFENQELELSGSVTYSRPSNCNAVLAEFDFSDGTAGVELLGWDSTRKILLCNGYGSTDGRYWRFEADKITDDTLSGIHQGVLPDGTPFKSRFSLKRTDDNHFEWKSTGKTNNGDALEMGARFSRVGE